MDMAVGVIVGGAFTAIVTSLNQDILTPILAIFGGTDFSNLYVKLGSGDTAPVLMYGNFITAVINFLITAFVIFCLVKFINKLGDTLHHREEAPAVLKKKDKARANHYKYYTDQEWGMASNYDLCLNSGLIGIEGCVKAIQQVLELTE